VPEKSPSFLEVRLRRFGRITRTSAVNVVVRSYSLTRSDPCADPPDYRRDVDLEYEVGCAHHSRSIFRKFTVYGHYCACKAGVSGVDALTEVE
jgi:hypothetical protein